MLACSKKCKPSVGLKVARVSTVGFFVETQLKQQIESMVRGGMDVTVVASEDELLNPIHGVTYKSIKIAREISLLNDLAAIFKLIVLFKKIKFNIVHSTTPKAGLVSALAAYIAMVPVRIHTYTGQVWVEKTGVVRLLSMWADRLIGLLNTQCYADSHSQVEFLIRNRIVSKNKICCLGFGSLAGVDLNRFNQVNYSMEQRAALRNRQAIPKDSKVLTFIGRCTKDKGILELLKAFEMIVCQGLRATLLVVGPVEDDGLKDLDHLNQLTKESIRLIGYSNAPELYLSVTDILLLPSYREGFGTVVIEAAAMGVPAIGTRIPGLEDAIADNETGLLVAVKNQAELADAIKDIMMNEKRLTQLGIAALNRAKNCFSSDYVNQLVIAEYRRLAA